MQLRIHSPASLWAPSRPGSPNQATSAVCARTIAGAHGLHGERGAKAVGGVLVRGAQRAVGRDRRQRPAQLVLVQL